jgi:AraC-like DNA-binding protein
MALAGAPEALEAFWAATDVTPEMLADGDARVSPAQFCVAWAEALRLSRDPALALTIARATPPGAFGIVEYVCRSLPTLGDALSQWCRYLRILDDAVEVGLVEAGRKGIAVRVITESEAPAPASHELCFALLERRARELVGRAPGVVEVSFAHTSKGPDVARYKEAFGVPVRFGATHTEMVFAKEALATSLATADANLLAILVPAAEAKAKKPSPEALLGDQVTRAMKSALRQGDADIDAVAKQLGMTSRSLQRRLKDEGTSFQTLREDTRRVLADGYLKDGLSFAEISFLLGFSEPSAFFRAFKRWTGRTPVQERDRLRLVPAAYS